MTQSTVIQDGETIVCETSDERIFVEQASRNKTIRFGKTFVSLAAIIGKPYGSVFELQKKSLIQVSGGLLPDAIAPEIGEVEMPSTDNRSYGDTNSAQKLSTDKIAQLKEKGASGSEIIDALVQNSETWQTKTEFSKQKYLAKKQKKYMPRVRILRSTSQTLGKAYMFKKPAKICNLRSDSLGQILMYGNVYAGANVLVLDGCMGLVLGAVAERLSGLGRILSGFTGQQPAQDAIRWLNFDKTMDSSIVHFPCKFINILHKSEEELVELETKDLPVVTPEELQRRAAVAAERDLKLNEKERANVKAKLAEREKRRAERPSNSQVRDMLRAGFDSLIIAGPYNPCQVLKNLLPLLKLSKPFVIYHEYLEPLVEAFHELQQSGEIINMQLSNTWTREYQVLPARTHPNMKMSSCSGYILTGIKVRSNLVSSNNAVQTNKKSKMEVADCQEN